MRTLASPNFARTIPARSGSTRTVMCSLAVVAGGSRASTSAWRCSQLIPAPSASSSATSRVRRLRAKFGLDRGDERVGPLPGQAPKPAPAGGPRLGATRGFRAARGRPRRARSILFQTSISRGSPGSMPRSPSTATTSSRLRRRVAMGDVAHMEDQVGLDHLLQGGAEGRHQHGRQVGNEADRIGHDDAGAVRQVDRAQCRVEGRRTACRPTSPPRGSAG